MYEAFSESFCVSVFEVLVKGVPISVHISQYTQYHSGFIAILTGIPQLAGNVNLPHDIIRQMMYSLILFSVS